MRLDERSGRWLVEDVFYSYLISILMQIRFGYSQVEADQKGRRAGARYCTRNIASERMDMIFIDKTAGNI